MPAKIENDLSDMEIVEIASDNHIWLNAFSTIRPTDEFLRQLGQMVLDKVRQSDVHAGDGIGRSRVTWLRVNAS